MNRLKETEHHIDDFKRLGLLWLMYQEKTIKMNRRKKKIANFKRERCWKDKKGEMDDEAVHCC